MKKKTKKEEIEINDLDLDPEIYRKKALGLYRKLYKKTPNIEYKKKIEELERYKKIK